MPLLKTFCENIADNDIVDIAQYRRRDSQKKHEQKNENKWNDQPHI